MVIARIESFILGKGINDALKRAKIYSLAKFKINCDKLSKQDIAKKILDIYEK